MAEPVIVLEANEGSEGAPVWALVEALRGTGPGGLGTPFAAPVNNATDQFFDNVAAPNDGQIWNDKAGIDTHIALAGRNINRNVLRIRETGGADGTADAPILTAFDDATDAANRIDPTSPILTGTGGTANNGLVRGIETTLAAPGAGWTGQVHDAVPAEGAILEGTKSGVVCASALPLSGTKTFNLAIAAPHDPPPALSSFVIVPTYTYE